LNYLTATQLRISMRCRAALIETLRRLETGVIARNDFKMDSLKCCFYGHAQSVDPGCMPPVDHLYGGLLNLCFPFDCALAFNANRSQGAHALRNYLVAGRADWPAVMRTPRDPVAAGEWRVSIESDALTVMPAHALEAA